MEKMGSAEIIKMLGHVAQAMKDKRQYLIELDSTIGDGDLGITMEKGFEAAYTYAKDNQRSCSIYHGNTDGYRIHAGRQNAFRQGYSGFSRPCRVF